MQTFTCMDWKNSGASLYLLDQEIPISPAPYSNPTHVEASSLHISTLKDLRERDLQGKIVIIHGELAERPLMPKNFPFYSSQRDKEMIGLLEEKAPKALITISPTDGYTPIIEDGDFHIPCGILSKAHKDQLLKEEGALLQLTIKTERIPSTGSNIIAYLNREVERPWVFSAHIDTTPTTPGALDNGGGVALLLALGDRLKERRDIGIQMVLFNGEDYYSNPGEVTYLEKKGHTFPSLKGAINCDGVGLKGSKTALSFMNCTEEMIERVLDLSKKYRGFQVIEPWPNGDHMIFAMERVPVMIITSKDIFPLIHTIIHTERDTLSLIDLEILRELVSFLEELTLLP